MNARSAKYEIYGVLDFKILSERNSSLQFNLVLDISSLTFQSPDHLIIKTDPRIGVSSTCEILCTDHAWG